MARGLGTGPVCFDCAAQLVLPRSPSLLSRLALVIVGCLGTLGLATASSISRGVLRGRMFYGLGVGLWTRVRRFRRPSRPFEKALLATASSISRGVLRGRMFNGLGVGHWTRALRLRRFSWAGSWCFVTFETLTGRPDARSTGPCCGEEVQRARCSWSISATRALDSGPERVDCVAWYEQAAGASLL